MDPHLFCENPPNVSSLQRDRLIFFSSFDSVSRRVDIREAINCGFRGNLVITVILDKKLLVPSSPSLLLPSRAAVLLDIIR